MSDDPPVINPSTRLHAMDSLRAVAMLLGVFLHAALSYMTLNIGWAVHDEHRHALFDLGVAAIHGFRMQLFFAVAGFFARLVYVRYGGKGFIKHRAVRIGVPFVVGMIVLSPIIRALWVFGQSGSLSGVQESISTGLYAITLPTAHLWFLQFLLVFYALTMIAHPMLGRSRVARRCSAVIDGWLARILSSTWKPILLTLPTATALSFSPQWSDIESSGQAFVPSLRALIYYGTFYAFGWFLHRQSNLLPVLARSGWRWIILAVPFFVVGLASLVFEPRKELPHYAWIKLLSHLTVAAYAWFMMLGVMGLFLRYGNRPSNLMRYAADSSYWIYLMHLPLVVYFQIVVARWEISSFVKFALINVVALAFLFLSYQVLVRHTFIGRILNGPPKSARGVLSADASNPQLSGT